MRCPHCGAAPTWNPDRGEKGRYEMVHGRHPKALSAKERERASRRQHAEPVPSDWYDRELER